MQVSSITFADKFKFVRDCALEKQLLWYVDSKSIHTPRELRYEIEQFGKKYPMIAEYMTYNVTWDKIVIRRANGIYEIDKECGIGLIVSAEYEFLCDAIMSLCDLLRLIRMFDIPIDYFVSGRAKAPAKVPQPPKKTQAKARESSVIIKDIAGLISNYLTNIPANLLKFALVCHTFADVSLEKLQHIRRRNWNYIPSFMDSICKFDVVVLEKLNAAIFNTPREGEYYKQKRYLSGHPRLIEFMATTNGIVVEYREGQYTIRSENRYVICKISDTILSYRRRFVDNTMKKYSGMSVSEELFLILWLNYEFKVIVNLWAL